MYEEIAAQIRQAARNRNKLATFHYLVLINADLLADVNPIDFCRQVGMGDSFATEFRKMIGLAKLMEERGVRIS